MSVEKENFSVHRRKRTKKRKNMRKKKWKKYDEWLKGDKKQIAYNEIWMHNATIE